MEERITMNLYENSIIIGEQDYVLLSHFSYVDDNIVDNNNVEVKTLKYSADCLPAHKETNVTTINILYVLNNLLKTIKSNKDKGIKSTSLYSIAIPDKVYKIINKGLYKSWIRNLDNKDKSMEYLLETEQWYIFANLYKELFLDISFKGISYYANIEPKFNVKYMNLTKQIIERMKTNINREKDKKILDLVLKA